MERARRARHPRNCFPDSQAQVSQVRSQMQQQVDDAEEAVTQMRVQLTEIQESKQQLQVQQPSCVGAFVLNQAWVVMGQRLGMSGFHFRGGGGGSIEPPKTGEGGFGKRAQLTDTILTNEKVRIHVFQEFLSRKFCPLCTHPCSRASLPMRWSVDGRHPLTSSCGSNGRVLHTCSRNEPGALSP